MQNMELSLFAEFPCFSGLKSVEAQMKYTGSDDMAGQLLAEFLNVYPKQIRACILLSLEVPAELEQSVNLKMAFLQQHHLEGIHIDWNCICWC